MIPVNLAKQSINPHPVEFGDDRMEKKQMADITTITIRDIFLDNLPENVSRRDGEEFWDAWLDEQRGGVGDEMPTPPVGFHYEPDGLEDSDYGEPSPESDQLTEDQKRDLLGLVHDYAASTAELTCTMLDHDYFDDPQVRELVRQAFRDLECAGSHVSDALKLMGWTADDATVG